MERSDRIKGFTALGLALGSIVFALWGTFVSAETKETEKVVGEGPQVIGSDAYRVAGADGTDIKIAIIDIRFASLSSSQASDDAPPWSQIIDTHDFRGGGLTSGSVTHGTKCLEAVYDHAPGAKYCLYRVLTGTDASQLTSAIDRAIAKEVDIISASITYFNQGWEDGSGGAGAAMKTATDAGILVFAASGNFAKRHWRGDFSDPDEDGLHNWLYLDEHNDFTLPGSTGVSAYLQWDTSTGVTNYDLYLYNATEDTILASSTEPGEASEVLGYTDTTGVARTVKLRVTKVSGSGTKLQMFARDPSDLEHIEEGGSISSTPASDEPNVVAVGAVHVDSFFYASGKDGIIKSYSSLGPTNSGRIEPDLVAPTECTTSLGIAYGTSAAAPNAAGAAAAFWSADTNLSATGIRHLLLEMAEIFKDWGVPGKDTIYGHGGMRLHTYHVNTIWVDKDTKDSSGTDSMPYYYVADAQDSATPGGRVVFLGDNYPEAVVLNKKLLYESIGGSAVLGK